MGKIEGGEERFLKKICYLPHSYKKYIRYWYINFIIVISAIDDLF